MKRKVIILPIDGSKNGQELLASMETILDSPGTTELISHIKLNDGVHNLDVGGPALVFKIMSALSAKNADIKIFLDLKIFDVSATVENVLKKYAYLVPDILTVSASCSVDSIIKLKILLPNIKLAMVSMLTDIGEEECQDRFGQMPAVKIFNDLMNIRQIYKQKTGAYENWQHPEPFDLVVCSAKELKFLKNNLDASYGFIVPGIRDEWMKKKDEHQKRVVGIKEALDLGATYAVMGAQMTKGNPEMNISAEESRRLTSVEINKIPDNPIIAGNPLATLKACGGYYKSPEDNEGHFMGPLAAYAGTYDTADGPKNYVGVEYFNFACAEDNALVRDYFASLIATAVKKAGLSCNVALGAPMGGILLAGDVGRIIGCRSIFAEKKILAVAKPAEGLKEISGLIVDRHTINDGDKVIIVEDVCNNFSTTEKLQNVIKSYGGELVAIACAFNRSGKSDWKGIPVLAGHFIPTEQFRQDDEKVAELVKAGKVIWKPKAEWGNLLAAMEEVKK